MSTIILGKAGIETTGAGRYAIGLAEAANIKIKFINIADFGNYYNYDIVIIVGFIPEDFILFLQKDVKYYYIYCSSILQAELSSQDFYSPEIVLAHNLNELISQRALAGVITTSKSMEWIFGWKYIPPYRAGADSAGLFRSSERSGYSMIGNLSRKHKNVFNTVAAISQLPKEPVYVSDVELMKYVPFIFKCNIQQYIYGADYFKQIAKHKLCFQCDVAGTFSYIALEYALVGVPTICSPFIDWYPISECFVDNVDSPEAIYSAAMAVLEDYSSISDKLLFWAQDYQNAMKDLVGEIVNNL